MRVAHSDSVARVAGDSHPGLQREINEDRFHYDPARGIFMVVDGVGGHAAGEQAADIALSMLRARLERETGPIVERIREAITIANNEIHRRASLRPEWKGMACVLTVAIVENGRATVGHVGDTRLYKLRHGRIAKVTLDHSPVGEREDSNELSEAEAMRHPRRNEVYRDVGSEPHDPGDPGFIDIVEVPFEPDAALLLCSDGLTDLVPSGTIADVVRESAGNPDGIVRELIDAANHAGGKDNVTVVYAEGPQFASARGRASEPVTRPEASAPLPAGHRSNKWLVAFLVLLGLVIAAVAAFLTRELWLPRTPIAIAPGVIGTSPVIVVSASGSIGDALQRATAGTTVIVEPGEYRERLRLPARVSVVSRVSRLAVIRLPGGASEAEAAVVAVDVEGASFSGFRIVGDAATPLGTGLYVRDATINITDVEISGAKNAAVEFAGGSGASMSAADVHDNPGTGLAVRAGAAPRIAHSYFAKNGLAQQSSGAVVVEAGARPRFIKNVFIGVRPETLRAPIEDNQFVPAEDPRRRAPAARGRGGRQ
jgi:serine/threonine protein phosphatase PrpC